MSTQRLLALALAFWALPSAAIAQPLCKPKIAISNPRFSEVVNLRRFWSATLRIDASACTSSSGLFALAFVRLSETAPDLEFTEPFIWRSGQTEVRLEFWADEAVERYWVADIAPCPCRAQ